MPTLTDNAMFLRTEADAWSIYATSTFVSGSPAIRVQHDRPSLYARSTDTSSGTPAYIRFNSGSANAIDPDDYVVLPMFVRHDGTSGDLRWRVRYSDNTDLSSPTRDSGTLTFDSPWSDRDHAWDFYNASDDGSSDPAQYVGIDFWDVNDNATYIDIGRILIGQPLQLTLNVRYGATLPTPTQRATTVRGDRGAEYVVGGKKPLQGKGAYLTDTVADLRTSWMDFTNRMGITKGFAYLFDPTDTTYKQQSGGYFRFSRLTDVKATTINLYGTSFAVKEVT
jgi:hypothetical protein